MEPAAPPTAESEVTHTSEAPQKMRYCPACGYNLTGLMDDHCPNCFRPFDPFDPKTTSDVPPQALVQKNYWLERERLAGYAALLLALIGRLVVNLTAPGWAGWLAPKVAEDVSAEAAYLDRVGQSAGSLLAGLSALLLIPWLGGTIYLLLMALDDRLGGRLMPMFGAAVVMGCILVIGYHPGLFIMAALVGLLTALIYRAANS